MDMVTSMFGKPTTHGWCFMGAVVITNEFEKAQVYVCPCAALFSGENKMISGKERNIVFKNLIHDFRKSESDFDIMEKLFKNKREEYCNLLEELPDPNEWD